MKKILNKKVFSDRERVFPIIYEIDETDKIEDENCWIKANPCIGSRFAIVELFTTII